MEQESLKQATELVIDAIQNSDINLVDKLELMMNINMFLTHYHEAIKQRFDKEKPMKEPYRWNYTIRVKTKEGTFEYEDTLENIDRVLERHPNYEEVQATHRKSLVKAKRMNRNVRNKK